MPIRICEACKYAFKTMVRNRVVPCPKCGSIISPHSVMKQKKRLKAIENIPEDPVEKKEKILKEIDALEAKQLEEEYIKMKSEPVKPKVVKSDKKPKGNPNFGKKREPEPTEETPKKGGFFEGGWTFFD